MQDLRFPLRESTKEILRGFIITNGGNSGNRNNSDNSDNYSNYSNYSTCGRIFQTQDQKQRQ